MTGKAMLPMGIENFQEIRTGEFYYVDKTGLIKTLLENFGKVTLFTRPRRFGKTLMMSMLRYFFETGSDSSLFDGLKIAREKELCDRYMGTFPVISISLKDVSGRTFESAKESLRTLIGNEAVRFSFLAQSDQLSDTEHKRYQMLIHIDEKGSFDMGNGLMEDSLRTLSQLLEKYYGRKVILLIDEYDVPLDYAYRFGYYDDMVELVKKLFGQALKTNESLYMAVLTGCLRISKESIFTGLNNFSVYTVKDVRYNEYFGFTDKEVLQMLEYYGRADQYDAVKEWYDGYLFGNMSIYCPWDVINYCDGLRDESVAEPQNYWVNTSSNDIIRKFVSQANASMKSEIELLINGGSVKKKIRQELTYRDLDSQTDNLWSVLFTTGYLTQCGKDDHGMTELIIPNKEIQWIFEEQIRDWFAGETQKNTQRLERFCRAFAENDAASVEEIFNDYLGDMISIRDTNARKNMKENFYHGLLLGILGNKNDWVVRSNAESGDGYSDISIEIRKKLTGIVIELKYAEDGTFEAGCREAVKQLKDRNYEEALVKNGMRTIYRYGIACYRKCCRVVSV